jgi:hypothetical protein
VVYIEELPSISQEVAGTFLLEKYLGLGLHSLFARWGDHKALQDMGRITGSLSGSARTRIQVNSYDYSNF